MMKKKKYLTGVAKIVFALSVSFVVGYGHEIERNVIIGQSLSTHVYQALYLQLGTLKKVKEATSI